MQPLSPPAVVTRERHSDIAPRPAAAPITPVRPDAAYLRVIDPTVEEILAGLARPRRQLNEVNELNEDDDPVDARQAYLCACLAAWSYSGPQALSDIAYRLGFGADAECYPLHVSNSAMFTDTDAFYLRTADGRLGVLCFRGTELDDVTDLLTDIDVLKAPFPHGEGHIHQGFLRALLPVWDPIVKLTTGPDTRVDNLWITGHSLGGALAAITALALSHWGHVGLPPAAPAAPHGLAAPTLRGLFTYGQPMVGDARMAAWADQTLGGLTHRFIYGSDVVPHLPPVLAGRFAHFGQRYRMQDGRFTRVAKGSRPDRQSLSALAELGLGALGFVARRLLPVPIPLSLGDHMPANYLRPCRTAVSPAIAFP